MVRVVKSNQGNFQESTTSVSITLPPHDTGDLVLLFVGCDNRTLSGGDIGVDFTQEVYNNVGEDIYLFSHIGKATPMTSFSATASSTNGIFVYHCLIIKGHASTGYIDNTATGNTGATNSPTGVTITPNTNNCLVINYLTQGGGHDGIPEVGSYFLDPEYFSSNISGSIAWTYQKTAAATGTWKYYKTNVANDTAGSVSVSIKNSGTDVEAYSDPSNKPATLFYNPASYGDSGELSTTTPETDFTSTGTNLIPSIDGETTVYDSYDSTSSDFYVNALSSLRMYASSVSFVDELHLLGAQLTSSQNLSGKKLSMTYGAFKKTGNEIYDNFHALFGLTDGTNYAIWKMNGQDTIPSVRNPTPSIIEIDNGDEDYEGGTFNSSSVSYLIFGNYSSVTQAGWVVSPIYILESLTILGGNSTRPANFNTCVELAKTSYLNTVQNQIGQAEGQFFATQDISIGNGTDDCYWDSTGQSIEYPAASDIANLKVQAKISTSSLGITIDNDATLDANTYNMGDYHNWYYKSGTVTGAGLVINSLVQLDGPALTGWTFNACKEITHTSLTDLSGGNIFSNCVDAQVITITSEAEFNKLQNCTFSDNSALSIKITGNQTGTWSASGMSASGGLGSYDIEYTGTTDFTIEFDVGSGFSQGRINNSSTGTLTASTPSVTLTVNSNVASSDIKIFNTGTQTIESQATGTTTNTTTAGTYDWTVMKTGYVPQRGTGVVLGASSVTVDIELIPDPIYDSGHGITWTTDYEYNATTRELTIVSAQEGRNIYSSLIEEFISRSALDNRPFPMTAIGPDRIDFTSDGTTAATINSGDITFWRGAGMEWEHATTGNKTHKFCSIKGVGTNGAGTKGYYQYAAGSGTTALSLVSNNIDQVLQYYSDPNGDGSTADGYDRSTHLVIKLFNIGYYQKRQDVLTAFGISALESFEYTLDFQMTAFDFSSGDQSITIATLTDHTGAPIDPASSGNAFSYELVDPGANTGEELAAQLNYDIYTDPTATIYTSYTAFNLPDIIISSGGVTETEENWVEDESDTLGFYVSRSSVDHPDFTRFEDDDGTYYTPTVTANVSVTGMPTAGSNIRLQLTNETGRSGTAWSTGQSVTAGDYYVRSTGVGDENNETGKYFVANNSGTTHATTEPTWDTTAGNTTVDNDITWTCRDVQYYSNDPGASSYTPTYTDGEEFSNGDSVRLRFAEHDGSTSFKKYDNTTIASSSGFSFVVDEEEVTQFGTNAIDGSTLTMFSADYTNDEIDISADTDFTSAQAFAYYCYQLTTADGIEQFWEGMEALDSGNYKIVTANLDLYFDNIVSNFVKQIDGDTARIYRDDGTRPYRDPTTSGYGLAMTWKNQVHVTTVTGGNVITGDIADVPAAVWDKDLSGYSNDIQAGKMLKDAETESKNAKKMAQAGLD